MNQQAIFGLWIPSYSGAQQISTFWLIQSQWISHSVSGWIFGHAVGTAWHQRSGQAYIEIPKKDQHEIVTLNYTDQFDCLLMISFFSRQHSMSIMFELTTEGLHYLRQTRIASHPHRWFCPGWPACTTQVAGSGSGSAACCIKASFLQKNQPTYDSKTML